ncbi:unnamed protein product [Hydatigera taeniaeformis]|uniref:Mannosyl-glycoprotein endo-beta-N-acetylglucosaminidase n=1 Tax=Hydatigena taeniaeformis TaxID=6205 RepID=A0A0R3WM91_HYDTA|nr:unnamed protein product [Hydatigera taeniaeformis]
MRSSTLIVFGLLLVLLIVSDLGSAANVKYKYHYAAKGGKYSYKWHKKNGKTQYHAQGVAGGVAGHGSGVRKVDRSAKAPKA